MDAEQDDDMTATDVVANLVTEQLQLSGERDRLKAVLLEDLKTHGWTEAMFKAATKAATAHQAQHESVAGSAKSRQVLTARQLADLVAKHGRGKFSVVSFFFLSRFCLSSALLTFTFFFFFPPDHVPDAVRTKLLHNLVLLVREFMSDESFSLSSDETGPGPER